MAVVNAEILRSKESTAIFFVLEIYRLYQAEVRSLDFKKRNLHHGIDQNWIRTRKDGWKLHVRQFFMKIKSQNTFSSHL